MELAIFIVIVFAGMIGVIFVYQYLQDKLGLDVSQQKPVEPVPPPTPVELFNSNRVMYDEFCSCLYDCLKFVDRICKLNCPRDVQKLYAAQVADRVRVLKNGAVVFFYEAERSEADWNWGRKPHSGNTCENIADTLKANFPAYLTPGLSFSDIRVANIPNNYVRIAIININSAPVNYGYIYTGGSYTGGGYY